MAYLCESNTTGIKRVFVILVFALSIALLSAQEGSFVDEEKVAELKQVKREINASKIIDNKISIDGVLDEFAWSQAEIADKFTTLEPDPGKNPLFDTQVKMLYDDEAIYLGVFMLDNNPDSILREMTLRDNIGNADYFAASFDFLSRRTQWT